MGTASNDRTQAQDVLDLADLAADLPAALVAAKLEPPVPVPWLLPRHDLVTQLCNTHARLCLISAPAGWGKTSLLSAWHQAESGRRPFAYLHLDPGDDDAAVLWAYIIAAVRSIHPSFMPGVDPVLRTPGVEPMRRIVPAVVNELGEIDEPLVLVLDDYHVLKEGRLHTSVLYLLEHLPPAVRLGVATRADPPLPLGRLRASGEMFEVRASQLRFSEAEAAQLLNGRFDLALDPESVRLLWERTEGWPAALQLAGLSLDAATDGRRFIEQFAGDDRNIADYLTGEVLNRLPTPRREFLLRTSVLDRLTGPLCDAVVGVSGSARTLEELESANLFLVPLDNRRRWYRYHHLFGEWLRHELHRTEPALVPELHERAGRWHDEHGSLETAISHAVIAGDYQRAGELIDRYLTDWVQVNWASVRWWLARLPNETVERHPMAATAQVRLAWARGDFSEGLGWIPIAEASLDAAPEGFRPAIETMVALFRAFGELVAGDIEKARTEFERIAEQERPTASLAFAMAIGNCGIATFWTLGALEAIPALREGVVAQDQLSLPDSGATALLAAAYAEVGDLAAAEATAQTALVLDPPIDEYQYPYRMPAHYALGRVLIARGDHDEGIGQINQGLEEARRWVEPIFIAYGCLALAEAVDDYAEKRALVREARQLIEGGRERGRIGRLVTAAERKLSLRQPTQRTAGTVHVEPLTERERQVVRLLTSDLSLREIASELFLSHNTVKGHTKSIYRKLGVSSRASAIETARGLEVL